MTPKLLTCWKPHPENRGVNVLCVYRIERNRFGVLVYRLVERVSDERARWSELTDHARYAPSYFCAHNRRADVWDMRRAAGFDLDTPDEVVRDWWDENVPVTDAQWKRAEREKVKVKS